MAIRSVTITMTCKFSAASLRKSTWRGTRRCWTSAPAVLCCASPETRTSCSRDICRNGIITRYGTSFRSTCTSTSSTVCHAARARSTACPAVLRERPNEKSIKPRLDVFTYEKYTVQKFKFGECFFFFFFLKNSLVFSPRLCLFDQYSKTLQFKKTVFYFNIC